MMFTKCHSAVIVIKLFVEKYGRLYTQSAVFLHTIARYLAEQLILSYHLYQIGILFAIVCS